MKSSVRIAAFTVTALSLLLMLVACAQQRIHDEAQTRARAGEYDKAARDARRRRAPVIPTARRCVRLADPVAQRSASLASIAEATTARAQGRHDDARGAARSRRHVSTAGASERVLSWPIWPSSAASARRSIKPKSWAATNQLDARAQADRRRPQGQPSPARTAGAAAPTRSKACASSRPAARWRWPSSARSRWTSAMPTCARCSTS